MKSGIRGMAHAGVCVPDLEEAVAWYTDVLGMVLLSPPAEVRGPAIEQDMGEMIPGVELRAAILGFEEDGDRVVELLEYPKHPGRPHRDEIHLTDHGISHLGLVCDDIEVTRRELEEQGVRFLTSGIARLAGLRTTWFRDPWGLVYILIEKSDESLPYYLQWKSKLTRGSSRSRLR